jgi:hypothetical protein
MAEVGQRHDEPLHEEDRRTPVDRPFSNGGQLMYHEVFIYVEDIIGSTWVSDTPASNFVSGITAPLRGLIL